jgi:hypothetical protein
LALFIWANLPKSTTTCGAGGLNFPAKAGKDKRTSVLLALNLQSRRGGICMARIKILMKIRQNLKIAAGVVGLLWLVFFINHVTAVDLRQYGLRPRHIDGLPGILFAPYLHGDFRGRLGIIWRGCTIFVIFIRREPAGRDIFSALYPVSWRPGC